MTNMVVFPQAFSCYQKRVNDGTMIFTKIPSHSVSYQHSSHCQKPIISHLPLKRSYCVMLAKSCTTKKDFAETCWNSINHRMFAIYQLQKDGWNPINHRIIIGCLHWRSSPPAAGPCPQASRRSPCAGSSPPSCARPTLAAPPPRWTRAARVEGQGFLRFTVEFVLFFFTGFKEI